MPAVKLVAYVTQYGETVTGIPRGTALFAPDAYCLPVGRAEQPIARWYAVPRDEIEANIQANNLSPSFPAEQSE